MTGVALTTEWGACARCAHGEDQGRHCTAGLLRTRFGLSVVRVEHVRALGGGCGPDGQWFAYRRREAA